MRSSLLVLGSIGACLLILSSYPLYLMFREWHIQHTIMNRYLVLQADQKDDFPATLQSPEITAAGQHIRIVEKQTGRFAPQTPWDRDEHVPAGEIIEDQIELNGKPIADPTEMWLSNRQRGGRYFSWLDIVTVRDRETGKSEAAIVQRLTGDNEAPEYRQWRIITVHEDGSWEQRRVTYKERSKDSLGVRLIMVSGTALLAMGYYSDILMGYPGLLFPFIYPWLTSLAGFIAVLIMAITAICKRRRRAV